MKMWRQGDVLIMEAKRPREPLPRATSKVLVYGEATGHAHRVESDTAIIYGQGDVREIEAPHGFKVVHEEHDAIEIPEGYYRVRRQREYDEKEIRYVAD